MKLFEWLTLGVLAGQSILFWQQLKVMRGQKDVADGQRRLQQDTNDWRRDEAIGQFYKLALGVRRELEKANGLPLVPFNFQPGGFRTSLDTAASIFSPLGNTAIMALTQASRVLEEIEQGNFAWGQAASRRNDQGMQEATNGIRDSRRILGTFFEVAQAQIPAGLRWTSANGDTSDFQKAFSDPKALPPGDRPNDP